MTTYTGVAPGVRELDALTISKISVGPMDNNSYLLQCKETGVQLMIDAANEPAKLLSLCDGRLDSVVTTHRHQDHWAGALAEVVAETGARTYAGRLDADGIEVPTDVPVDDGDTIHFGAIRLEAIHLSGHTAGSISLLYSDPAGHPHLFTGDCLFPGGIGGTWGDADAFASLMDGVETKVFGRLPDVTWIYPGHGKDTTLGDERPSLPEWRARGW